MPLENFKLDEAGIAQILVSPEVGTVLLAYAEKALAIAETLSADFAKTGHYASSFETSVGIESLPVGRAHDAQVATLTNSADYSLAVEYGFEGRSGKPTKSAHSVLRRTMGALVG